MPRRRASIRLPHGSRLPRWCDLLPAERELVVACREGRFAKVGTGQRPTERTDANHVRAVVLRTICLGTDPAAPIHEMGVQLVGAWIDDTLDLEAATLPRRLLLVKCRIDGEVRLRHATTTTLALPGSRCAGVVAGGIRCRGDISLRAGFSSNGEVDLRRATIEGDLDCSGGVFETAGENAISADRARIEGGVYFQDRFHATGEVRLHGTTIDGNLVCSGRFENGEGKALSADGAEIGGSVFFDDGFHATGAVRLLGASIGGSLNAIGSRFENGDGNALCADRAEVGGGVFFTAGFSATGEVRLLGSTIDGNLDCSGGRFENGEGNALSADGAEIGGAVFFKDGFHAIGGVRLPGAKIGNSLECSSGRFENHEGNALSADGAEIGGAVFFRDGFHAIGAVRLLGAKIGDSLSCSGGRFENATGHALSADRAEIRGSVFLKAGFHATGQVRLIGARIGSGLACSGGRIDHPKGIALALDNADVAGTAFFPGTFDVTGKMRLAGASIATLIDHAENGPALVLDGFTWTRFGPGTLCDAASRIAWLDRQIPKHLDAEFKPQPWEQCATVLAAMGHEDEARTIRIEKRRRMRRARWLRAETSGAKARIYLSCLWDRFLDISVGYGWRPMRPVAGLFGLWLAASLIYAALPPGIMAPTDSRVFLDPSIPPECRVDWIGSRGPRPPAPNDLSRRSEESARLGADGTLPWTAICPRKLPSEYSAFQPWLYALDVLLPIVDLRQERDWAPRVTDMAGATLHPIDIPPTRDGWGLGYIVRAFEWFLIGFGWVASLLLAAAVSGVVRRD